MINIINPQINDILNLYIRNHEDYGTCIDKMTYRAQELLRDISINNDSDSHIDIKATIQDFLLHVSNSLHINKYHSSYEKFSLNLATSLLCLNYAAAASEKFHSYFHYEETFVETNLGYLLLYKADYIKAIERFKKAIKQDHQNSSAYYGLLKAYNLIAPTSSQIHEVIDQAKLYGISIIDENYLISDISINSNKYNVKLQDFISNNIIHQCKRPFNNFAEYYNFAISDNNYPKYDNICKNYIKNTILFGENAEKDNKLNAINKNIYDIASHVIVNNLENSTSVYNKKNAEDYKIQYLKKLMLQNSETKNYWYWLDIYANSLELEYIDNNISVLEEYLVLALSSLQKSHSEYHHAASIIYKNLANIYYLLNNETIANSYMMRAENLSP